MVSIFLSRLLFSCRIRAKGRKYFKSHADLDWRFIYKKDDKCRTPTKLQGRFVLLLPNIEGLLAIHWIARRTGPRRRRHLWTHPGSRLKCRQNCLFIGIDNAREMSGQQFSPRIATLATGKPEENKMRLEETWLRRLAEKRRIYRRSQHHLETPFTTAAIGTDVAFWRSYIASRPTPPEDFFQFINAYHASHGDSTSAGTPGEPFHRRGAEGLSSYLDNIAVPAAEWENVQRHKWNCGHPLLFNSTEGFDFEVVPVDRRAEGEKTTEVIDREFWAEEWDVERTKAYIDSVYPNYRTAAGERYAELEAMLEELREAMGGGNSRRKVSFPVVLILATRK
ncbi:hypothetical protein MGYG_08244 [Nannizzia gypsea CBS 118893]|uniref:Uncharacterized protein n=1 Tax=Arthroderma gypseum (strain ATCC MYA-4604 / CBS 118893) TaxID=535722 RepID=E4V649_ARTGP|nr:hypothetical protein MGYG_08244 [Nannizzia gypsea CBS 118893]EFR05232.1 hypothetical protein MGYG_08244 [Nannizzia gypsea CBS 118893]